MRNLLRLGVLAVAGFLSLATSPAPYPVITSISPPRGETAVPVDATPTIAVEEIDTAAITVQVLTAIDRNPVPGESRPHVDAWGNAIVSFVPAEPLPPDTDFLFVIGGLPEGVSYWDPVLEQSLTYEAGLAALFEFPFSTRSVPQLRLAWSQAPWTVDVSFSQAMDPATLTAETVKLQVPGADIPLSVDYAEGELHQMTLHMADDGPFELVLLPGIRGADGTDMPGLPRTVPIAVEN